MRIIRGKEKNGERLKATFYKNLDVKISVEHRVKHANGNYYWKEWYTSQWLDKDEIEFLSDILDGTLK